MRILFVLFIVALLVPGLPAQTAPAGPGTNTAGTAPPNTTTAAPKEQSVRIKDLVRIDGLRENQLTGLGLVTGLAGQGDSPNNAMLQYALSSLAGNLGLAVAPDQVKSKNTAVVTVSCTLPPYLSEGDPIDITVSSLGDAKSLEGGYLLQTPLLASNGQTYAVAQGKLLLTGGKPASKTVFSLAKGAIAEKAVTSEFLKDKSLHFLLNRPDFTTAQKIGQALTAAFPQYTVTVADSSKVVLSFGKEEVKNPVDVIAQAEALKVVPDFGAKVVINRTSGVVVAGRFVQIAKVAVSVRGAKVTIGKSSGSTASSSSSNQTREQFLVPESSTVEDLVTLLQQIGLNTDTIIEVFRAIDQAGALYGTLEITDR